MTHRCGILKMPLKNVNSIPTCQVYYCTRARRDASKPGETRPDTCILQSLSLFFFTRHLHVENAKRIADLKGTAKMVQVFVYHTTEHNLRSPIFRSQLLEHLAAHVAVLLLRRSDLPFSGLLSFFVDGCTIELRHKLKFAHEKAVIVFNDCYEDAVLDLVKEIKKLQEACMRKKLVVPQTFPVVIGDTVSSMTFGMSINNLSMDSVTNPTGQNKTAVRLVKKTEQKAERRDKPKNRLHRQENVKYEADLNSPLAVKGIALQMRKSIHKEKKFNSSSSKDDKDFEPEKPKPCQASIFVSLNQETPVEVHPNEKRCGASDNGEINPGSPNPPYSFTDSDIPYEPIGKCSSLLRPVSNTAQAHSNTPQQCRTLSFSKPITQDYNTNINYEEIVRLLPDIECDGHTTRTYALFFPDRWVNDEEQLLYITFPDESDKIPLPLNDLSISGHSTPCSLNLSEECVSPVDSPLICEVEKKKTIYAQPCPVYPLETSFPPVDLPVDFAS